MLDIMKSGQIKLFEMIDILSQTGFLSQYIYKTSYSVPRLYTQRRQKRISCFFLLSQNTYTTHDFFTEIFVPNLTKLTAKILKKPLNGKNPLMGTKITLQWPLRWSLFNRNETILSCLTSSIASTSQAKYVTICSFNTLMQQRKCIRQLFGC